MGRDGRVFPDVEGGAGVAEHEVLQHDGAHQGVEAQVEDAH